MTTTTRPKSIAATVVGAVLVLYVGLAILGGALAVMFGSYGTVTSGSRSLSTARAALATSAADFSDIADASGVDGELRIRISAKATGTTEDLFIGIGPAARVDRYLASVPVDEVTDVDVETFKLTRKAHAGTKRPAPPASQDFWVARSSGHGADTLKWTVRDGDYRLVLMNADGTRGVNADGSLTITLPHVPSIVWALLAGGSLLALASITAVVLSVRRRRSD